MFRRYDIWCDGSAAVHMGAGWLVKSHQNSMRAGSIRITCAEIAKPDSGYAEIRACTLALEQVTNPSVITVHTDHKDIGRCLRDASLPIREREKNRHLVNAFNQLMSAARKHVAVTPVLSVSSDQIKFTPYYRAKIQGIARPKHRPQDFSDVAHDAVHILAAQASGATSFSYYPEVRQILDSLDIVTQW